MVQADGVIDCNLNLQLQFLAFEIRRGNSKKKMQMDAVLGSFNWEKLDVLAKLRNF